MIYVRPNKMKSWQINLPLIKTCFHIKHNWENWEQTLHSFFEIITNVFISELSDSENSVHILQFLMIFLRIFILEF